MPPRTKLPPGREEKVETTVMASNARSRGTQQQGRDPPSRYEGSIPPTNRMPQAPYKLGETAQECDIVRFRSKEQSHETLPKLPIGTPLFVKRSNRTWTYARIVSYRRPEAADASWEDEYWNEGKENFIVVVLDEDHSMRKFIGKDKWYFCVRLVKLARPGDPHGTSTSPLFTSCVSLIFMLAYTSHLNLSINSISSRSTYLQTKITT